MYDSQVQGNVFVLGLHRNSVTAFLQEPSYCRKTSLQTNRSHQWDTTE